jgi:plastocyanin
MKRLVLLGGVLASLFAASPALGADTTIRATEVNAIPGWDQTSVGVQVGDTVTWTFEGMAQAHNVESGGGDWVLDSRVSLPAPPVSYKFEKAGTFRFLCEVHPDTMFGDVAVGTAPPPVVVLPLSQQPYLNDDAAVLPLESNVTLDKAKPKLSSVSARRVAKGAARVRFRVSEESDVSVAVKRGGRTVKSGTASGSGRSAWTVRGLRAGRYTIQVRATDIAGNRSSLRTLRLNVR